MAITVEPEVLRELEQQDPETADSYEETYRRAMEARYPKPTDTDVAQVQKRLESKFASFHGTEEATTPNNEYDSGMDSIRTIRRVRYGEDAMPDKLKQRLQYGYRIRSMLTHFEIEMVVALLGRNPLQYTVPPAGESEKDRRIGETQTKWLQHLADALERAQGESIVSPLDDSNAECSVQAAEIFLTGRWDDIDEDWEDADATWDPTNGESPDEFNKRIKKSENDYHERLRRDRRRKGLPFGLKPIDPVTLYFDDPSGDGSDEVRTIKEMKPYRQLYERMKRNKGEEWIAEHSIPAPQADGVPEGDTMGGAPEVETLRYYDCYWYVYTVGGKVIECEPHGMPFNPVVVEIGNRTSASTFPQQFHGVTWGRASIERALNDTLTSDFDSHVTYGARPMPMFVADANQSVVDITDGSPKTFKFEAGTALPPGYRVEDAFKDFRGATSGPFTNLLMSLHRMGGVAEIASGNSPGADTAGYTVNMLMGAAMAKYEGLISAKKRFWQKVGDRMRLLVRDTIGDTVELVAPMGEGKKGVRWLTLSPEDVDETPCVVEIDPLSDENRIAMARWLIDGMERGLVPEHVVMEKGYGADDVDRWRAEIYRDKARRLLGDAAVQEAVAEIAEAEQAQPPVVLGPNGEPISTAEMQAVGALPPPNQPPSVGAQQMEAQNSSQPWRQGTAGQRPPGLQRGEGQNG